MKDGFLKAAALSPALRVADCAYNVQQITEALRSAAARGVKLAVFPEFCLTGYTCGDLFLQRTLQTGALDALNALLTETQELDVVALVGLPLLVHGKLYNCAAVLCHGKILGLVPKTYLPNYGEFYEKRQFTPGSTEVERVEVCGQQVPFGTSLLFRCRQMPSFVLGVEICEDLWSALPPSTFHALAGATVIANLSASDETVGKAEYRRALVSNQSARLLCSYRTLPQAMARAPRTWCSRATTSLPRTAPSWPRTLLLTAARPRPRSTASAWKPSVPATPVLSCPLRATPPWSSTWSRWRPC